MANPKSRYKALYDMQALELIPGTEDGGDTPDDAPKVKIAASE